MTITSSIAVITGAAGGIGKALAKALIAEGTRVMIADLPSAALDTTAAELKCAARACDVTDEAQVKALVAAAEAELGAIDLFCSNAGVLHPNPDLGHAASAPNEAWAQSWAVNVMAHVYAARAVVPLMKARDGGRLLNTVSAAGLLSQIDSGPYTTTKHAAIGFAEHLAIVHRDDNIKVSVLCPQAVDTAMARRNTGGPHPAALDGIMTADEVAACAIEGLKAGKFLILPHPVVADYMASKARDYDRWLGGMAKLLRNLRGTTH